MSKDEALEFLKHMSSDPETRERVAGEYKRLLQDLAKEKGLAFDEAELTEAAQTLTDVAAGELGDAAIAMVSGGRVMFTPEGGVNMDDAYGDLPACGPRPGGRGG
jgi:hypothetical protein